MPGLEYLVGLLFKMPTWVAEMEDMKSLLLDSRSELQFWPTGQGDWWMIYPPALHIFFTGHNDIVYWCGTNIYFLPCGR